MCGTNLGANRPAAMAGKDAYSAGLQAPNLESLTHTGTKKGCCPGLIGGPHTLMEAYRTSAQEDTSPLGLPSTAPRLLFKDKDIGGPPETGT